jgi:origin recognition complex subunit 4
LYIDYE